jgi:hypothetical protein
MEMPKPSNNDVLQGQDFVQSPFWKLRFDPGTGIIQSLQHLESGRECFDSESGWDLFAPVQETVAEPSLKGKELGDPRYDLFKACEENFAELIHTDLGAWVRDWKAKRNNPKTATRLETFIDGEAVHLRRWVELPGVHGTMVQTISLLRHEPRVRFTAYFNKSEELNPESLYFMFPMRIDKPQAHFDSAGVPVAFDKEQLPGVSRNWFTAGSFVAVEGTGPEQGCITLACPDAPLFQLGGFNYGREQCEGSKINQALVLAWPTNNYWNTNFRASQPGHLRFQYELEWTPAYSPAGAARFAASVARPVIFHPVTSMNEGSDTQCLLEGVSAETTVVTLKSDGDKAVIVGLRNHSEKPISVDPVFPGRTIAAVSRVNALAEEAAHLPIGAPVELPARRTSWYRFAFSSPA